MTLSESDRRRVADWAADCADLTLSWFELAAPHDPRPRAAIEGARAFARGELRVGIARRLAAGAHAAARGVADPAATAAARAAGHAVATAHMASHALGAPAYAALAAHSGGGGDQLTAEAVCGWALDHASAAVRGVLCRLPIRPQSRGALGQLIYTLDRALRAASPT
ncbi:MAG: putative immunity protein [Acidimicrobiia bacterium]